MPRGLSLGSKVCLPPKAISTGPALLTRGSAQQRPDAVRRSLSLACCLLPCLWEHGHKCVVYRVVWQVGSWGVYVAGVCVCVHVVGVCMHVCMCMCICIRVHGKRRPPLSGLSICPPPSCCQHTVHPSLSFSLGLVDLSPLSQVSGAASNLPSPKVLQPCPSQLWNVPQDVPLTQRATELQNRILSNLLLPLLSATPLPFFSQDPP